MSGTQKGFTNGYRARDGRNVKLPEQGGEFLQPVPGQYGQHEHTVLRGTLAEWLSSPRFSWRYFITLTYRDARPRSLDFIGAELLGTVWELANGRAIAFVSREYGKRFGRLHHHALLCGAPWSISHLRMCWKSRQGHFGAESFDPRRGAAYYVAKYVLKDEGTDSDWSIYTRQGCTGPAIPGAAKRKSGWQLYCDDRVAQGAEKKKVSEVQCTQEETQEKDKMSYFPLPGFAPDVTLSLRR